MNDTYISTLSDFLNTPINSGDAIFERFAALAGATVGKGTAPLQRYVYIPGTRSDRVVLVAHIDTVWDGAYKRPFEGTHSVIFEDGVFRSVTPECGIGADDRAGCAMLWQMRECGHSILIVDGEEYGKVGAKYLKKSNPKLFRELNRHAYMIELDWMGTNSCLFNQVDNTDKFKRYIENELGFIDSKASGGCDLQILCRHVCGVNVGVGYYGWHTAQETLVFAEWENTLHRLSDHLAKPQPRFKSRFFAPYARLARICVNKGLRILKIKKQL